MATLAIGRETGTAVIRVGSAAVITLVTSHALVGGVVITVTMAGGTVISDQVMRSGKWEYLIMLCKVGGSPTGICSMTFCTILREAQLHMIWLSHTIKIIVMACNTFLRQTFEGVGLMTFETIANIMTTG
ncbi:MAG: hypothetical protein SCALA702_34440 [Melioribacteraceae bacterium]|nr:MAG: hypothetical protein SCALA702_34440 [Melioribacteraceae bacterium]